MEQDPPVTRNTFVLVAVILFNLIWLTLLFLSCQADNEPNPTPTPDSGIIYDQKRFFATVYQQDLISDRASRINPMGVPVQKIIHPGQYMGFIMKTSSYSVPLYNPPSTCSITPLI